MRLWEYAPTLRSSVTAQEEICSAHANWPTRDGWLSGSHPSVRALTSQDDGMSRSGESGSKGATGNCPLCWPR
jgi:hypothetical protein